MREWFRIARRRDVVARGLKVALLVGTALTAINQGDVILSGQIAGAVLWKVPLTFLVPYCVSTYAGVEAIRKQRADGSGS